VSAVMLKLMDNPRFVYFAGNTYPYKDIIKVIPGARWNKTAKVWYIPIESVQDALRIFPSLHVDSSVKNAHASTSSRLQAALELKGKDFRSVAPKPVPGLNATLRNYQQLSFDFLHLLGPGEGAVLGLDMGLGKSVTMLAYFLSLMHKGIIDYALVVCPSPLKYATWAKEIQKFTNIPFTVIDGDASAIVEWDNGKRERLEGRALREVQYQQWMFGSRVLIMNYELFLHDSEHDTYVFEQPLLEVNQKIYQNLIEHFNVLEGRKPDHKTGIKKAQSELLPKIVNNPKEYTIRKHKGVYSLFRRVRVPSILPPITDRWAVFLDEAHRIKNPKSDTTKKLLAHLKPAGRKVLGTGTPLENNIVELYSLVDFSRPGILGTYYDFLSRYVECDDYGTPIAPKPQMLQELRDKISPIMIRFTKQEVLPELPPLERVDYSVSMTDVQKKLYDQIKEGILVNVKDGSFTYMDVIVQLTRLQQVLDSPALLRKVMEDDTLPEDSGKLRELVGIISDIDPKRNQFLIFSQYAEMTDILYRFLTTPQSGKQILKPSEVGYVRGGMTARQIENVREAFQAGRMRCVIMTTAGNYGLDLYKASYAICYDQLFNPQKMEQFLSRGHRSGNTTGLTAITLTTKDSYEEKKQALLERKRELFKAMVDEDEAAFMRLITPDDLMELL